VTAARLLLEQAVCVSGLIIDHARPIPNLFPMNRVAQNAGLFTFVVQVLYFYNKTHKYDNVRVAPRTLVKVVLNVSSTGCNNERQSFAKLSYSAGLQDFFQVLNVSNATSCWSASQIE